MELSMFKKLVFYGDDKFDEIYRMNDSNHCYG